MGGQEGTGDCGEEEGAEDDERDKVTEEVETDDEEEAERTGVREGDDAADNNGDLANEGDEGALAMVDEDDIDEEDETEGEVTDSISSTVGDESLGGFGVVIDCFLAIPAICRSYRIMETVLSWLVGEFAKYSLPLTSGFRVAHPLRPLYTKIPVLISPAFVTSVYTSAVKCALKRRDRPTNRYSYGAPKRVTCNVDEITKSSACSMSNPINRGTFRITRLYDRSGSWAYSASVVGQLSPVAWCSAIRRL